MPTKLNVTWLLKLCERFVKLHNMRLLNLVIGSYIILKAIRTKLIS